MGGRETLSERRHAHRFVAQHDRVFTRDVPMRAVLESWRRTNPSLTAGFRRARRWRTSMTTSTHAVGGCVKSASSGARFIGRVRSRSPSRSRAASRRCGTGLRDVSSMSPRGVGDRGDRGTTARRDPSSSSSVSVSVSVSNVTDERGASSRSPRVDDILLDMAPNPKGTTVRASAVSIARRRRRKNMFARARRRLARVARRRRRLGASTNAIKCTTRRRFVSLDTRARGGDSARDARCRR